MGLFSDSPPLKSFVRSVSLSGSRGGGAASKNAPQTQMSASVTNSGSDKRKNADDISQTDIQSGDFNSSQKDKRTSASGADEIGSCSGNNMQQLSTSWEYIKLGHHKPTLELKTDDERDELQDVAPPRFIKISDGKISLGPPKQNESCENQEILEARIVELEESLLRLHERVENSHCGSPTLAKDLKEQLENMSRAMKLKERRAMQACRDHKVLQARFTRQETLLQSMQQENKSLHQRIRQYEHCLDDVMHKVVDAILAEDSLREEVAMLKGRVRDLEAQNAALSNSPVRGKDEGYCTMSSGQPQPSNGHLEDLPEEPEQWLVSAEPCSADMEDWSMSQEELAQIALEESNDLEHDWVWNSSGYLNSTMIDSQSDDISQLLKDTIIYSEDEEIACIDFTRDFYKLVNIKSGSTKSLQSHHMDAETDDENEADDDYDGQSVISINPRGIIKCPNSPTSSEAGHAEVASCSSSSDSGMQPRIVELPLPPDDIPETNSSSDNSINMNSNESEVSTSLEISQISPLWRKSNGWKRLNSQKSRLSEPKIVVQKQSPRHRESKIPPPVPVRRSYAC